MENEYRSTKNSNSLPPLGEYITKELIVKQGYTQEAIGKELGLARQTIGGLISGKIGLSKKNALKLEEFTGMEATFWLNLESEKIIISENQISTTSPSIYGAQVLEEWQKRGTRPLNDLEIIQGNHANILGITNFDEGSLEPNSYDLRIGSVVIDKDKGLSKEKPGPIAFTKGETAVIKSLESFNFPRYLLGRLGIMFEFAGQGILIIHGLHIDSGYKGYIYCTAHNISGEEFKLEYGQKFLSLELNFLVFPPKMKHKGHDDFDKEHFPQYEEKGNN